ncbi:cytochrome P450 2C23-like isoform X1 [Hypanus sabinus]|uniref:cytochrome P450 2C23-like isoform X1 n=2 Tax=Hypanus sabinus TaxID=79690 RepID=UPI0028C50F19|nr:cytochrome P450 2C23-like isoform X1 [Hypanus sabinus]XP_059841047.1 cytochrome P450 2C23-like isoform X1 [Hypanus sabinus]
MSFGEPLTTLLVVLLSVLLLVRFFKNNQRQKGRLPPGPPALPIVGNLFQLDFKAPHKSLIKLSEQYGPVFTFWFGSCPAVVVCGAEVMREALIDHGYDFSGRYLIPAIKKVSDGYGINFSSGERWKQLRRFTLSTLRNFGMGKKSAEERIQEEAQFLVTSFMDKKGEPFNPDFLLRCATSNIICSITVGKRFGYKDKQFLWLMELVAEITVSLTGPWIQLYNTFPRIMDFLPGPHQKFFQNITNLRSFLAKTIQSHKETVQKDSPRDYIDCFLTKMDEDKDELNSEFFQENLLVSTESLFLAGTETSSTTLCWALQILAKYPEVQEKIHNEIDDVIGSHRRPAIEDRVKMPYTDAVIHEVQRYINITPMSLPHMATSDVNFRGYLIPKGMLVMPVLSSVLKDNSLWESPESFNANHFLDENGCFKKSENFVAFSAGICIHLFILLTFLSAHLQEDTTLS